MDGWKWESTKARICKNEKHGETRRGTEEPTKIGIAGMQEIGNMRINNGITKTVSKRVSGSGSVGHRVVHVIVLKPCEVLDHVLVKTVASHSISKLPSFSPQDKANTVWAFAKQDLLNQPFMDALAVESFRCISEYTQQHISNISWAFAKLLVRNTSLLTAFAGKIHVEIEQAQAQTLSSMAWSFARLAMRDTTSSAFLASISKAAQQRLPQFGAQEIANSSWAFAMMVIADTSLFNSLASSAKEALPSFLVLHVSNTLWAFAAVAMSSTHSTWTFLEALAEVALTKISAFGSQSLSATAWSLAKLILRKEELLEAISAQCVPCFAVMMRYP